MPLTIVSTCESPRSNVSNPKDYSKSAIRLVKSIRKNGGTFKDIDIYMFYSEGYCPPQAILDELVVLGCKLIAGPVVEEPLYTKVQAIADVAGRMHGGPLLWLDSDMLVLKPLDLLVNYFGVDAAACATERSNHRWVIKEDLPAWQRLCQAAGVSFHQFQRYKLTTMIDEVISPFNFNSGIMLFGSKVLVENYVLIAKCILDKSKSNLDISNYCFDATALTLAVVKQEASWTRLPMKLNHYVALLPEIPSDTVIVHYQDNDLSKQFPELW